MTERGDKNNGITAQSKSYVLRHSENNDERLSCCCCVVVEKWLVAFIQIYRMVTEYVFWFYY